MSWIITPQEKTPLDQDYRNVSLLLHGDGANNSTTILDSSPSPKTVTAVGNAQISTAQSKFGGGSIAFDGNGDYLNVSGGFVSGTEDFTIEWWEKLNATSISYPLIQFDNELRSGIKTGNNAVQIYRNLNQMNITYPYTSSLDWQHLAISRRSGTVRMFASGLLLTNPTSNLNQDYSFSVTSFAIGRAWVQYVTNDFAGYINDLRITKGVARYTANFTPPTAPFPDAGPAQ